MNSGTLTNCMAYDAKLVSALHSAGGFAGQMKTGGAVELGSVNILGLNLNAGQLLNIAQLFVPAVRNSSVQGYVSGLTVQATGTSENHCGYSGGYVGSAYGAQIQLNGADQLLGSWDATNKYPDSSVPFHDYDWTASNRSNRYFYDLYGVYQNADAATAGGIKKAPAQVSTRASTGIVGTCPSCKQYSLQGTYVSTTHTSRGHQEYYECYKCHYVQNLGTYVYKDHGSGSYGSWTCPDCGSHTWVLDYENDATCTRNGYREYSCDCGQSKRETIYATGHSYSYGSWEQYSTSQHRREAYCRNCGDSDYEYASHSMSYGSWSNSSSSQHSRTASCRTCGYSTTDYGNHSYSTGSWSKYSDTQHRRSKTCSGCGASTYDYADHSYSYSMLILQRENIWG